MKFFENKPGINLKRGVKFEDLPYDEDKAYDVMCLYKIGSRRLDLKIGNIIEMSYDLGCGQTSCKAAQFKGAYFGDKSV